MPVQDDRIEEEWSTVESSSIISLARETNEVVISSSAFLARCATGVEGTGIDKANLVVGGVVSMEFEATPEDAASSIACR